MGDVARRIKPRPEARTRKENKENQKKKYP